MIEKRKSWPLDDRPREKLLKKGAGALSNSELLAILLRTGTAGTSAVDLFYMRTKAADPQIIAREGIFLNQELLDLGLAKLYKDPSSAPVKPGEQALLT